MPETTPWHERGDYFVLPDDPVESLNILREAAGREFAKRGVRKLMVRRVLRRGLMRKRAHPARKPAHKPAHKDVPGPPSHA